MKKIFPTKLHGFTLVELIVVITILVILGTIGFISISGFSGSARDSSRVSDLTNIAKGLDIVYIKTNSYPLPDNSFPVVYSGGLLWSQGNVGDGVMSILSAGGAKINKKPTDPLYQTKEYTYSKTAYGNAYQIKSDWEGDSIAFNGKPFFDPVYAATGNPTLTYTKGNYNGLVVKTITGSFVYVLAVPSIVTSQTGTLVDVLSLSGKLLVSGKTNSGGIAFTPSVVFSGASLPTNDTSSGITNLVTTLQATYSGSVIATDATAVKNLLSTTGSSNVLSLGSSIITSYLGGSTNIPVTVTNSSYNISNSLLFDSGNSQYLSRTPSVAGNQKKWTWSGWLKRTNPGEWYQLLASYDGNLSIYTYIYIMPDNTIGWSYNNLSYALHTKRVFSDPSAWYHLVFSFDSANAQANLRYRIFVNGKEETDFDIDNRSGLLNQSSSINTVSQHAMQAAYNGTGPSNGYLSEINFVDSGALDQTAFGEFNGTTGQWVPKQFTGDYGNNGFHLDFSSGSSLGADSSGKGNNWTTNGGMTAASNQVIDTPLNNFATLNPLNVSMGGYTITSVQNVSKGGLKIGGATGAGMGNFNLGTHPITTQKIYFEGTVLAIGAGSCSYGIWNIDTNSVYSYDASGNKSLSGVTTAYGATFTTNDVIGVKIDPTNRTLEFLKNNVSQGVINSAFASGTYIPFFYTSNGTQSSINFGQKAFVYTPPTSFLTLSTANFPTPAIVKPKEYFDVLTYAGNSTNNRAITGLGFQPDLVWIKNRTNANDHQLYDSVRGPNKKLSCNAADSEYSATPELSSFDLSGFTLGNWDNRQNGPYNYVAWNWKAGGAAAVNTAGSITSQVSANPTAGFSIVSYTGNGIDRATVGHGLGSVPKMIFLKNRTKNDATFDNWWMYHSNTTIPANRFLKLNGTDGEVGSTDFWSTPTNNTIGIGGSLSTSNYRYTNDLGSNYLAYIFAEVPGYSKFGSYTGNGSTDGPFVYTGFRPAYVLVKRSGTTIGNWLVFDTARSNYNSVDDILFTNLPNIEALNSGGNPIDFISNGFKVRAPTGGSINETDTYIYAAFAEAPFKYANAK